MARITACSSNSDYGTFGKRLLKKRITPYEKRFIADIRAGDIVDDIFCFIRKDSFAETGPGKIF